MEKEIERKFLVKDGWKDYPGLTMVGRITQGYLTDTDIDLLKCSVRVRVVSGYGYDKGYLTIKSNDSGISRDEFEHEIPLEVALQMLRSFYMGSIIEKTRYILALDSGQRLEVDEFAGDNAGLVIAEVELNDENDHIDLPDFIGGEVSDDTKYFNLQLVENPYKNWK